MREPPQPLTREQSGEATSPPLAAFAAPPGVTPLVTTGSVSHMKQQRSSDSPRGLSLGLAAPAAGDRLAPTGPTTPRRNSMSVNAAPGNAAAAGARRPSSAASPAHRTSIASPALRGLAGADSAGSIGALSLASPTATATAIDVDAMLLSPPLQLRSPLGGPPAGHGLRASSPALSASSESGPNTPLLIAVDGVRGGVSPTPTDVSAISG